MNKDEFISYLQDPREMGSESIAHVSNLIYEFPYCQSARILLTLYLYKEQSIRFDAELKTTAVYVNNRSLLKKHIDSLNTGNEKVVFPDEEVSAKHESNTDKVSETETVVEKKTDGHVTDVKNENESKIITEVRNIIKSHIQELETMNVKENEPNLDEKVKSVKSKSELIAEFIVKQPSISRPKAEFYDPVSKAKESIVDNENIVSETLANIFYDQGHLQKAIKIYQKLSLKFPEKSSYFAALIKKAEKELES